MNKLLKDYISKNEERLLTYKIEEDVNLLVDNILTEFPRLTENEKDIINAEVMDLAKAENEFYTNKETEDEAGYELIWTNHMKDLIEKL